MSINIADERQQESVENVIETTSETLPYFVMEQSEDGGGIVITVQGDLDLVTVSQLDDRLEDTIDELRVLAEDKKLTLDLKKLDFIDSAGLALLIRVSRELSTIERVLRVIVGKGHQPDRVLKIGQFGRILDLVSE
jgi:anti-anti-sigma factor